MADRYKVEDIAEEGEGDVLAPLKKPMNPSFRPKRSSKLLSFGKKQFDLQPSSRLGGPGLGPMGIPRGQMGVTSTSAMPHLRKSIAVQSKSRMLRQSIALFAKDSVLIKPNRELERENNKRMSLFPTMAKGLGLLPGGLGALDELPEEKPGASPKGKKRPVRASIFTRMEDEKGRSLRACGPRGQKILEQWYAFYQFWEYYTLMASIYALSCFTVLNPFSDEVMQMYSKGDDGEITLAAHMTAFLLVAKWTAACSYILFAELVFIYSRVCLGYLQMSPLHQFVPYMAGDYHAAHERRGWWFLRMIFFHVLSHVLRIAFKADMPTELLVSGIVLSTQCLLISVLAARNESLPCMGAYRWAQSYLRKNLTWEFMRGLHLTGVLTMMIAAWWHKFPGDSSPLTVWFPNRMFWLYMGFTAFYSVSRFFGWVFTVQLDITTHTIYKSCQLIVINEFPYAKQFCNHGRTWFSADAKIMFPDVDNREWHPFTCVVNAKFGNGFILVKNYGDWTSKFTQMPASYIYMRTPPIKMSFEISQKYTNVLVVASGTFITTVAGAVARAVSLSENDGANATQEITIVWIDREPIMIALVCLRLLSGFTNTEFRIYCTAKNVDASAHLDHIQIMSTMASSIQRDDSQVDLERDEEAIERADSMNKAADESDFIKSFSRAQTNVMDEGTDNIIDMLEDITSEFPNIEIFAGRPDAIKLFDELEPDFLFIGAAPPVARAYLQLAKERNVDLKSSSYL